MEWHLKGLSKLYNKSLHKHEVNHILIFFLNIEIRIILTILSSLKL